MAKDARLEMRVSTEEKESLRRRASESEQSVSNLLRQGVGLEAVSVRDVEAPEPPTAVIVDIPFVDDEKQRAYEAEMSDKQITTLARQRHGHLPLGLAERAVRKELDA